MLLAAGLTPAWQEIYLFDRFTPGEVNRAARVERCASGKVINVGVALNQLGCESRILSVIGGRAGAALDSSLASLGVHRRWIDVAAETRTCVTVLDEASGQATELVENAGPISTAEVARFRDAFPEEAATADFVVLTGSLPSGAPASFYRDLLDHVRCPVLLDIRGPELLLALEARPFAVKPNRAELSATLGKSLDTDADVVEAMAELNRRGAEWVVVSEGAKTVWMCGEGTTWRISPPRLERVINPIGCGDVLAAGLAAGLSRGAGPVEAMPLAIATAAQSAIELLPAHFDAAKGGELAETIQVIRMD
jgi:1-phosphofructokinase family hexose kinase